MYRKLTFVSSFIFVIIFVVSKVFLNNHCSDFIWCDYELRNSILRPLVFFSLILSISFILISLYPEQLVRSWCLKILSWLLPLAIFQIFTTDIYASGMFTPDRAEVAWGSGQVLFAVTVIFIIFSYLIKYHKKEVDKKTVFIKLLLIIPLATLLYFGKDIFFG
jgi:hypothetical protein